MLFGLGFMYTDNDDNGLGCMYTDNGDDGLGCMHTDDDYMLLWCSGFATSA